ncbi:hypothetical protein [Sinosporangium siamense]|uniref:Uncharacterized protein n=1 Tax=Sinosporangium siamense TaxID=1367973 RepID=A0A919RNA3_9ACTN|nr:hypothetical protein [Sinosporangium siamense]GII95594.1 hypothetical protein Ssi02_58250 [Sinosporangium siamense]
MANMDREAMQAAADRIQRLSDDHWWALDPSCRLMQNNAWMGPTGTRFGTDVHGDQRELRDLLAKAVHSARNKLATLPDKA